MFPVFVQKVQPLFNFSQDKARAGDLAAAVAAQLSPAMLRNNRKALSANKITRVLEKAFIQATAYQAEQRMGFVRRSLFANAFQWALKEQEYPKDFVVMATEGLVVAITTTPVISPPPKSR